MLKGVFFDLYDTLIVTGEETASSWVSEFYTCLCNYGLSVSKSDFIKQCRGFFSRAEPERRKDGLTVYERRIKVLCAGLNVRIDTEGIRRTALRTVEVANSNCFPDPECHLVLSALHKSKTLALITNYDHAPYIKTLLRKMDIDKYFKAVIVSEDAGIKKPDPRIFKLALEKTGLKPEEVIYVGDSIMDDVPGAVASGITPVLIKRTEDTGSPIFRDDIPTVQTHSFPEIKTIRKLSELLDIIR